MDIDSLIIALGFAAAGYFIGEGLKNFKNPAGKSVIDFLEEDDEHELIHEKDVHYYIGIAKADAKALLQEHPNAPQVVINGKAYYPKAKLREWLLQLGNEKNA